MLVPIPNQPLISKMQIILHSPSKKFSTKLDSIEPSDVNFIY